MRTSPQAELLKRIISKSSSGTSTINFLITSSSLVIEILNNNSACICITSKSNSYEECLNSEIISLNKKAIDKGIKIGMTGKEALLKMHEN